MDKTKIPGVMLLFSGFFCSFATLPYIWFILPLVVKSYYVFVVVSEVFAILAESLIYYFALKISITKAFTISLICNLTSFLLGFIIL